MSLGVRSFSLVVGLFLFASSAFAGPIAVDAYYEFGFGVAGDPATGCDPIDPAGPFCISSSGTPTTFLDAPAWTFTSGATGSTLTVTDAFLSGDRFQLFDFGASIGLTSAFVADTDCGDDPVPCLADPGMSHGVFALASGAHSITLTPVLSNGGGSGYLFLQDGGGPQAVPEPATLILFATGAGTALYRRRRQS